jgi:hypothetical protein
LKKNWISLFFIPLASIALINAISSSAIVRLGIRLIPTVSAFL